MNVFMYCPRHDKHIPVKETKLAQLSLESNTNAVHACPSYLSGHTLIFGIMPTPAERRDSVTVNGKKIIIPGGYLSKMFAYLAQKFGFQPVFRVGAPTFYPNNNSWGGTLKEVTFFSLDSLCPEIMCDQERGNLCSYVQ